MRKSIICGRLRFHRKRRIGLKRSFAASNAASQIGVTKTNTFLSSIRQAPVFLCTYKFLGALGFTSLFATSPRIPKPAINGVLYVICHSSEQQMRWITTFWIVASVPNNQAISNRSMGYGVCVLMGIHKYCFSVPAWRFSADKEIAITLSLFTTKPIPTFLGAPPVNLRPKPIDGTPIENVIPKSFSHANNSSISLIARMYSTDLEGLSTFGGALNASSYL
jgi:hypothetical protein